MVLSRCIIAILLAIGVMAQPALADSVNVGELSFAAAKHATLTFSKLVVKDSSLSAADVSRMLDPATPDADKISLAQKLSASAIDIETVRLVGPDSVLNVHDFKLRNVVGGRFSNFTMSGFDGIANSVVNNGAEREDFKTGPLTIENGDMSALLSALRDGQMDAASMRFSALTWTGLEAQLPSPEKKNVGVVTNRTKVVLESVQAQASYQGDVPTNATLQLKGFHFAPPAGSAVGTSLRSFGYEQLDLSLTFKGIYDVAKQTYLVDELLVSGLNTGALGVKGLFAGIPASAMKGTPSPDVLKQGQVASLNLRYVDAGLGEKVLAAVARDQGKSAEVLRKEWISLSNNVLPLMLMGDPVGFKLSQAFSSFLAKPGQLDVSVKPKGGPIGFAELLTLADPAVFLSRIELDASAKAP